MNAAPAHGAVVVVGPGQALEAGLSFAGRVAPSHHWARRRRAAGPAAAAGKLHFARASPGPGDPDCQGQLLSILLPLVPRTYHSAPKALLPSPAVLPGLLWSRTNV
ncbi:MAG: hypothetical protein QOF26_3231 [Baekduia sp.]|nr:hypothetical protein [Baekduia sp.]